MSDQFDFSLIERRKAERRGKVIENFEPEKRRKQQRQQDSQGPFGRYGLFEGMSAAQLDAVADIMSIQLVEKGEVIISEGEIGGEMFILLSGSIEISKRMTLYEDTSTDPKDKSLVRLHDTNNIFFGEMTMFGEMERSATVSALSDVKLGVLTQGDVRTLTERDPALGFHLFRNIGRKIASDLRRANRDILKLTTAFCLALEGK